MLAEPAGSTAKTIHEAGVILLRLFCYTPRMRSGSPREDLEALLRGCRVVIGYESLTDEVDIRESDIVPRNCKTLILPRRADADPLVAAERCETAFRGQSVCVFVPGQRFDFSGTRHGRGGGWYDRFLSRIPRLWIRVGVARLDQLSPTPLLRAPWDESVDWVIVANPSFWTAVETRARQP